MPANAKTKRQAIAETFGTNQVDPEDIAFTNFLYARRHCATVRDGKWRELRYVVELQDLEETISKTLDRIRERDGAKICREVTDRLVDSIAVTAPARRQNRQA